MLYLLLTIKTTRTHQQRQHHHQQGTRNDLPCSFLLPGLQPRRTLRGRSTRLTRRTSPQGCCSRFDEWRTAKRSSREAQGGLLRRPRLQARWWLRCQTIRWSGLACWHLCWRHRHGLESAGEHHGGDAVPAGGQQRRTGAGRVCD